MALESSIVEHGWPGGAEQSLSTHCNG